MKRFWVTLGIILTITVVVVTVGELVRASHKDPITTEVRDQTQPLRNCNNTSSCEFDQNALQELYNSRSKLVYYESENQNQ